MRSQPASLVKKDGLFFYLALLTGFFILLEVSYFIQCNKPYLSDFDFVSSNLHIPASILPGIGYFLFAQFTIHAIYCCLVWCMSESISALFTLHMAAKLKLGIFIWALGILTALVANQYFFSNSKFAELTSLILINNHVTEPLLFFLLTLSFIVSLFAIAGVCKFLRRFILPVGILSVVLAAFLVFNYYKDTNYSAATPDEPNIILIGMDSLRPDFLSYFGYERPTPFIDNFLMQSTVFSEAVTPLARTFPSWTSILTGEYPLKTGIRFNLAQQSTSLTTLPAILKRAGYETIYATDETRFSNIDKNYGFDHVITPPMGLNDFLLGTFNDFPLSNLIINTRLGKWLFPHSYANRAVFFAYQPESFLHLMDPALAEKRTKPIFLTVHFCLTHYPYLWATLDGAKYNMLERYEHSVNRMDRQLQSFFALLTQYHLLDHAIVVLLSDHGEALELPGDRITEKDLFISAKSGKIPAFYPPSLDKEGIDQSAGHGTDVLGLPQYHTLLAFRLYGLKTEQKAALVPGVVSLLSVKPTILDLLKPHNPSFLSLAGIVRGEQTHLPSQHVFLESDFTPEAIRTVYPETRKVMLEGIQLFQIDPKTTRLTVKTSMGKMIINSKQYADIYGDWMLALYPQNQHYRMPILINLKNGEWTNDLNSTFARQSPAAQMLKALKNFYGKEINAI